ncbi:MAG: iron ABC transporter permease [Anaerolineae bacterium]|nr:iron ABC transporter permease [Anaerolineae bacterium]
MALSVMMGLLKNNPPLPLSWPIHRTPLLWIGLSLLLGLVLLAAVGLGAVQIGPGQVAAILAGQIGLNLAIPYESQQELVLLAIRLPRVVLGLLIGAALAVSGAAVQGLFRNPLADPTLIGIASGAALAAVAVIVLGATLFAGLTAWLGLYTLPLAAFVGGMATTLLVYRLASNGGRTVVTTLLLAGIAINALTGAATGLLTFVATDEQLRSITFWGLGSLGGATWQSVATVTPFVILPLIGIPYLARPLNVLLLGEAEAGHLGVNVERVKQVIVLLVALAVGATVSVAGIIGFVGLVTPHLLRLLVGPDHRRLLPGSALLGATLLLAADLIARTIVIPAELPIGIVTAMLGAPFFLWLLLQDRRHSF